MSIKIAAEYEMPRWPNYLIQKMPPGRRQDGFREAPKIDLGSLDEEQVEALCANFRDHCGRRRLNLRDPRGGGRGDG